MLGIISLGAIPIMAAGQMAASATVGLAAGAATAGAAGAIGTVRLAKDSVQALSPIGAGGSQARKRLMERGLIESGVNRTKQLKRMAGKTAGLLGVNVSLASILKQSQIFTGVFGTVFQILGAFVDIMLIPLMPLIKWILNNMIDFIPEVQKRAASLDSFAKKAQNYLQDLFHDKDLWGRGGVLWTLAADIGRAIQTWWNGDYGAALMQDIIEAAAKAVFKPWWDKTPWGEKMYKDEADKAVAMMNEAIRNNEVYDTPFFPNVIPKFGVPAPSLGFGAGQTDEFADLGEIPEGYPGGPPAANKTFRGFVDTMQEVEADIQRSMNDLSDAVSMLPEVAKEGAKGLGRFVGMSPDADKSLATGGLMNQAFGSAGRALQGLGAIAGMGSIPLLPGNPIFEDQVGGGGVPYRGGFGELVTIGAVSNARSQAAAQAAINLSNQSKENYAAAYKDEASQYEDELYFQEMMLGVGRY